MKTKISFTLLVFILCGIYWYWFMPGPRVASDLPLVSNSYLNSLLDLPRVWSEKGSDGLGQYIIFTLWSWPIVFIGSIFSKVGLSFEFQERIIHIIPFLFIGCLGIWKLGESLKLSNSAKVISSLFYLTNTYILLLIDGGQLSIALAYALFPLNFFIVDKSIKGSLTIKVLAGVVTSILGFFDIRFIYILFLLLFCRFFYEFLYIDRKNWFLWIINWVKSGLVIASIVIALNFYWLLPMLLVPFPSETYNYLTRTSFTSYITLGHSILMLSPNWFKNIFGNITMLRWEFIFIPILVFLAPVLRAKSRLVGFWLLISIISIFLSKGSSQPFSSVYQWLFTNFPLFSLFRDSTKFFFLVALSYSILLGITSDEIIKKLHKFNKLKLLFVFSLICYLLYLIKPIWLGEMTGTFSVPQFQKEYLNLSHKLDEDKEFSRVFWIPTLKPLTNLTTQHPIVEAARLVQMRPFAIGTKGSYELFNFLREAPFMGEIFDISGIGYIAYPYLDIRRDNHYPDNIKYYYTFLDQLSKLPWISQVTDSKIPLLKTKQHQDRFFIASNIWWVIGSDSIYNESTKSSQLKLSTNALIFVEEYPEIINRLDQTPNSKIVLNKKNILDLAANFLSSSNLIFPAKKLDNEPDSTGWWKREAKDLIRWRDFLQSKYGIDNIDFDLGGGWAVGEGDLELKIQSSEFIKDEILLARVLESTRSGALKFYQDDELIGEINTKKVGNNIRWFEVGNLKNKSPIIIKSSGDINVINALSILDKNKWLNYKDKAEEFERKGLIVNFEKEFTKNNTAKVSYKQINPTKYLVNITNLTEPAMLVFSENYNNFWRINDKEPIPVYTFLNGFSVDKDGEYLLDFEPQKYVFPGFLISIGTLILVIVIFLKGYIKNLRSKI